MRQTRLQSVEGWRKKKTRRDMNEHLYTWMRNEAAKNIPKHAHTHRQTYINKIETRARTHVWVFVDAWLKPMKCIIKLSFLRLPFKCSSFLRKVQFHELNICLNARAIARRQQQFFIRMRFIMQLLFLRLWFSNWICQVF